MNEIREIFEKLRVMLEPLETPALVKQAAVWASANWETVMAANQNNVARYASAYIAGALHERERLRNSLALEGPTLSDGAPREHG
jgi:hypothetical protein